MAQSFTINDLLEGCKAGNRKMQEMLYRQTSSKLLAVCMRYARDRMEAEDVLQMGYIRIFQKIREYRGDGSFEGWMRKVMVNTAIESYRKNLRTLNVVPLEDGYEQASAGVDFDNLGMQDLLGLIRKLSDGYRIVFNMYIIEGYSHKEISAELGITEGTSKSQLSRARAILKEEIIKMEGITYAKHTG